MKADEKIIGEAIRRQRIKAEIPLEEVAARANLSPISVRALELRSEEHTSVPHISPGA